MRFCKIDGCEGKVNAFQLCGKHYQRYRKYGDPLFSFRPHASLEERFKAKFVVGNKCDCWNWTGAKTGKGYGAIQEAGKGSKMILAHRLSFRLHKGEIGENMVVMHSCDNPACVNPAHLSVGTQSENIKDAFRKGRKLLPHQIENQKAGPCAFLDTTAIPSQAS